MTPAPAPLLLNPKGSPSASTRRRVLIVSPHFPPTNAPDHQRIRVALPYLQEFGWEAQILAVQPQWVAHPVDPALEAALPPDLAIARTLALPSRWSGLGNLGWRCFPWLLQAGDRLLATGGFDLVLFSTTIFPVMRLGPYWRRRFGVPYVVDFQDPWRVAAAPVAHQRPGGRLKYALDKWLAQQLEPQVMQQVSQVISVSPAYPQTLQQRYNWLRPDQFTVLPFGAPEADFARLSQLQIRQRIFQPGDGLRHWVYVGRGGGDMTGTLQALFQAIRVLRDRDPQTWQSLRLHFVGTSYVPGDSGMRPIEAIAHTCGIGDLVTEHPQRIPYFEAQQLLVDSDGILLIGSHDPGYTASKLYPAILARKPLLAIFHAQSSVVEILRQCQAGQVVTFTTGETPAALLPRLMPQVAALLAAAPPPTDWQAFQPYTGREMTRQLCQVCDRCLLP